MSSLGSLSRDISLHQYTLYRYIVTCASLTHHGAHTRSQQRSTVQSVPLMATAIFHRQYRRRRASSVAATTTNILAIDHETRSKYSASKAGHERRP